jgi:uncharacterized membrane protein YqgA involved in biofilm formation
MQAILAFALGHEVLFCSIASLLVQEFIANNQKIQSNSLGQVVTAWIRGILAKGGAPQGK